MFLGVNIDMTEQDLIIQDLRRENMQLQQELKQIKSERDTLLNYAKEMRDCPTCIHNDFCDDYDTTGSCLECEVTANCPCSLCGHEGYNWKYRSEKEN